MLVLYVFYVIVLGLVYFYRVCIIIEVNFVELLLYEKEGVWRECESNEFFCRFGFCLLLYGFYVMVVVGLVYILFVLLEFRL